ncbi:conjugal transfer protein TraF [Escherichia coli]|uniref:conjugal transfer protein TraF n=1 Tax=Escherichia coli TaxID=562 RepID=UPI003DA44514
MNKHYCHCYSAALFSASGKMRGWQWYNEENKSEGKINLYLQPRQEPDIMQKLAALQTAAKSRRCTEAILYPGVDNFCEIFRLQNYWTQQAGLFTMS